MTDTLSLDQLRSFVAIAESGSYSRAAERVFRSQPALSMQMKRLEELVGAQLLDRNGRETRVTEAGEVLLNYARRILDLNEEAISKLSVIDTEGSVRIGVLEEVALGPLVDVLTKFGRFASRVNLEVRVNTSWELTEMIDRDDICLAVANRMYSSGAVIPLWNERYVWVMNPDYPLLNEDPLPIVMDPMSQPCPLRDAALGGLDDRRRRWNLVFGSVSVAALKAAINAGLGVGMLVESEVGPNMRVLGETDGFPEIPPAEIGLLRSPGATSEAVDCLADFLVRHLAPGSVGQAA